MLLIWTILTLALRQAYVLLLEGAVAVAVYRVVYRVACSSLAAL